MEGRHCSCSVAEAAQQTRLKGMSSAPNPQTITDMSDSSQVSFSQAKMPPLPRDPDAYALSLRVPPPPGSPYALPIPGSHGEGRTPVYRHWRFVDGPVLHTLDPEALTAHASFEKTAQRRPNNRCLGVRPWDPATRTYGNKFQWITYGEVAERRKNFGAGIVELHRLVGVSEEKYGVGVWSQNR